MQMIHLKSCPSTQKYVLENVSEVNTVVMTDEQTAGIGRNKNSWNKYASALAFTMTIAPNNFVTLTPLEMGLLVNKFLKQKFDVDTLLKWPNDIFNSHLEKCGGIIMHMINKDVVAVGIGINLYGATDEHLGKYAVNSLIHENLNLNSEQFESIVSEFMEFVLHHRMDAESVKDQWIEVCAHKEQKVEVDLDSSTITGTFVGIGNFGEALIKNNAGEITPAYSGSLYVSEN